MKLFFDIESTGLPKLISHNVFFPPELLDKYDSSRIIELGLVLCDKGKIIDTYNSIIKPENFTKLDPFITKLTGITDEKILNEGKDINVVFKEIEPFLEKANVLNSYNIKFDYSVLISEMYRNRQRSLLKKIKNKKIECTFELSKKILYLGSYKLEKVYKELFKEDPKQDHRALNDAVLCKDVYYKLKEITKK